MPTTRQDGQAAGRWGHPPTRCSSQAHTAISASSSVRLSHSRTDARRAAMETVMMMSLRSLRQYRLHLLHPVVAFIGVVDRWQPLRAAAVDVIFGRPLDRATDGEPLGIGER